MIRCCPARLVQLTSVGNFKRKNLYIKTQDQYRRLICAINKYDGTIKGHIRTAAALTRFFYYHGQGFKETKRYHNNSTTRMGPKSEQFRQHELLRSSRASGVLRKLSPSTSGLTSRTFAADTGEFRPVRELFLLLGALSLSWARVAKRRWFAEFRLSILRSWASMTFCLAFIIPINSVCSRRSSSSTLINL